MRKITSYLLLLVFATNALAGGTTFWHADQYDINGLGRLTDDELYRLKGVESNIQDQLDSKVNLTGNELISGEKTFTGKITASSTASGFHPCPSMTDTEMLAIASPSDGDCVNNTTIGSWLRYNATDDVWEEMGGGGISNWETGEDYKTHDVVIQGNKIYQCEEDHTAGTFSSDLSSGKWVAISGDVSNATGILPLANGGTSKALTAVSGGLVYTDADSMEILGAGTSGQYLGSNGSSAPTWKDPVIKSKTQMDFTNRNLKEIQTYHNQLTETDLNNSYLVETGNNNLLNNPSCENVATSLGWSSSVTGSATATFGSATNTNKMFGNKRCIFQCDGGAGGGTCTFYQDVLTKVTQGLVSGRIATSSTSATKFITRVNGVKNQELSASSTDESPYYLPEVLGGTSTGVGIQVTATPSQIVTGSFDDMFVGAENVVSEIGVVGPTYTWTPTVEGLGSGSATMKGTLKQIGDSLELSIRLRKDTTAGSGSAEVQISMPSGFTLNVNKMTEAGGSRIGTVYTSNTTTLSASHCFSFAIQTINKIRIICGGSSIIGSQILANADLDISITVPVNELASSSTVYRQPSNGNEVSEVIFTSNANAPLDFISAMNKTIGLTGADFNGQDYYQLYEVLWNQAGLSTTAGDTYTISSAKGASALDDWNAGKTIRIDYATNSSFIRSAGTGRPLGSYKTSQNKSHIHPITVMTRGDTSATSGNVGTNSTTGPYLRYTDAEGGDESHPNYTALNAYIRYRPASIYGNFAGFESKNQTSGYQKMSNGIIFQWFQAPAIVSNYAVAAQTVTYPTPFPNGTLHAQITQISGDCGNILAGDLFVTSYTASTLTYKKGGNGGNYDCTSTPQIFVIGY